MTIDKSKLTDEALEEYNELKENIEGLTEVFKHAKYKSTFCRDNLPSVGTERTEEAGQLYATASLALSFAKKDLRKFEKQKNIYKPESRGHM